MNISPKSLQIGGRIYDAAEVARFESGTTGIILYSKVATGGNFSVFIKQDGTAGYQVGASKVLTVKAVVAYTGAGGGWGAVGLVYGDTDVGYDSASAPTTPKYLGGFSTTPVHVAPSYGTVSGQSYLSGSVLDFKVPASKYLATKSVSNTTSVIAYCFIDDV